MDTQLQGTEPPAATTHARLRLAAGLSLCWLLATAYAFWWFQLRNLQPFTANTGSHTVLFDAQRLHERLSALVSTAAAGDAAAATVVHFWDPDCPCSRFNERHVNSIVATFRGRGVRFLVVARNGGTLTGAALQARAQAAFGRDVRLVAAAPRSVAELTPSSPATAILDAHGQLAYFGPYSSGALCTAGTGAFVEKVLDQLLAGHNPQQWNTWASGCFCRWGTQT